MYQVKTGESKDDLVRFLEIVIPVQKETANNAAMEGDDVGPKVGHAFEKQGKNGKFQPRTDDANDGVEDEMPVFTIELP